MPWTVPDLPGILQPSFRPDDHDSTRAILRTGFKEKGDTSKYRDIDWAAHALHENGAYVSICMDCNVYFLGHKRCQLCRRCWRFRDLIE